MSIAVFKEMIRQRDGYSCTDCSCTREQHYETYGTDLEVHRLTPGGPYTADGCVTLCKPCHGLKRKSLAVPGRAAHILSVALPPALKARMARLAGRRDRKIKAEVIFALERYLLEEEEREGLIGVPLQENEMEEAGSPAQRHVLSENGMTLTSCSVPEHKEAEEVP